MERKFERKQQDAPLGEIGDRSKPKDFDIDKKTINKQEKEKNK